jgi:hypothetical protein
MTLDEQSERATSLLRGKTLKNVIRFRDTEVMIEFDDGTRFYADSKGAVEISVIEQ